MSKSTVSLAALPPAGAATLAGLLWGLLAVAIWAGSFVLLRFGIATGLNPYDVTALRFATAALVLAPLVWRRGWALPQLKGRGLVLAIAGAGAPYALLVAAGLQFAPAGQAAALVPGLTAVFTAILGRWFLRERIAGLAWAGTAMILGGAVAIGGHGDPLGLALFVLAALLWAVYVIVLRRTAMDSLHAVAIVAVGSALAYLPIYVLLFPKALVGAPPGEILLQALYQGLLTTVAGLYAFNRAVAGLGAARGAAMAALIPVSTLALAAAFLGERPGVVGLAAAALIGMGVALVTFSRR